MTLEPNEIDLDALPHTFGGGLKREPVEELLQRVQREYSQLYYEQQRLKKELEVSRRDTELSEAKAVVPVVAEVQANGPGVEPAPQQVVAENGEVATQPQTQEASLERLERQARPGPPEPDHAPALDRRPIEQVPRTELDDIARLVLGWAHRTSAELRESSRRECELMLKKTRRRIAAAEGEFERSRTTRLAELEELDAMLSELRAQLQATLAVLVEEAPSPALPSGELAASSPSPAASGLHSADISVENVEPPPEPPPAMDVPRSRLEAAS